MGFSDRAYIAGGLRCQLEAGEPVCIVTVTEGKCPRPFEASARALGQLLGGMGRLREAEGLGRRFPYVAVPEPHRGQVTHWHVLVAGFRYCQGSRSKDGRQWPGHSRSGPEPVLAKRRLKLLYRRYGFGDGFVGLRAVAAEWDGEEGELGRVSTYLSKYLTKSGPELQVPRGYPLLRHSTARPWWPGHDLWSLRCARPGEPGPVRAAREGYEGEVRQLLGLQVRLVGSGLVEPGSVVL